MIREVIKLRKLAEKINVSHLLDEPMSRHTTLGIGGPADLFLSPVTPEELLEAQKLLRREGIPFFVLGEGANILVSDLGIRGAVIDMAGISGISQEGTLLSALAGTPISQTSIEAARRNLGGLENFYSMPGSIGGAVWMNARCYGTSIADVLETVEIQDEKGRRPVPVDKSDFSYKSSPYQKSGAVIISSSFRLNPSDRKKLEKIMKERKQDREAKGHFRYPCAGSVFKNNPAFGVPTGVILDRAGFKGYRVGGAKISDQHGNIIVNTGNATAGDVASIIDTMKNRVREETGLVLEQEILFAGEWEKH